MPKLEYFVFKPSKDYLEGLIRNTSDSFAEIRLGKMGTGDRPNYQIGNSDGSSKAFRNNHDLYWPEDPTRLFKPANLFPEIQVKYFIDLKNTGKSTIISDDQDPAVGAENFDFSEGEVRRILTKKIERSKKAVSACLECHGYICKVCDFDFEKRYGDLGRKFIHVHHINPISLTAGKYIVNAKNDLVPVCPNCHAMLHRSGKEPLSVDALKEVVKARST